MIYIYIKDTLKKYITDIKWKKNKAWNVVDDTDGDDDNNQVSGI